MKKNIELHCDNLRRMILNYMVKESKDVYELTEENPMYYFKIILKIKRFNTT